VDSKAECDPLNIAHETKIKRREDSPQGTEDYGGKDL